MLEPVPDSSASLWLAVVSVKVGRGSGGGRTWPRPGDTDLLLQFVLSRAEGGLDIIGISYHHLTRQSRRRILCLFHWPEKYLVQKIHVSCWCWKLYENIRSCHFVNHFSNKSQPLNARCKTWKYCSKMLLFFARFSPDWTKLSSVLINWTFDIGTKVPTTCPV